MGVLTKFARDSTNDGKEYNHSNDSADTSSSQCLLGLAAIALHYLVVYPGTRSEGKYKRNQEITH